MTIVHISDNAKLDLQQIYDFIAEYSVQYADNQLNRIIKTIEILKVSGFELSGMVDEYNSNYRRLIQGNYKILYQKNEDGSIRIHRIFDTRQSTQKLENL